jgi:hypothetical protein
VVLALSLGTIHFLIVGLPYVSRGGSGEGLLYVVFVDFPLFYAAELLAPWSLYNSSSFNFLLFPVMGTVMYAAIGYVLGRLLLLFRKRA